MEKIIQTASYAMLASFACDGRSEDDSGLGGYASLGVGNHFPWSTSIFIADNHNRFLSRWRTLPLFSLLQ